MSTGETGKVELRDEHPGGSGHRLVYLAPDCTDGAVKKRARGFVDLGHELICFSFRRNRYNLGEVPDWPNVELGESHERRLASRALSGFRALYLIYRNRRAWRRATALYARNLDLALLALLGKAITRCPAPLIYEVLDIHPKLAADGASSAMLRWIERRVLNRCRLLVVSSGAFLRDYFVPVQHFRGGSFLLENKWPQESLRTVKRKLEYQLDDNRPVWIIGWFGNLRCARSLEILTDLADALPDRVRIYLRGWSSLLGANALQRAIQDRANIEYEGEYSSPEDLATIYTGIHFNWCADLSDGKNSLWLLPNRLYEGGYFGVPALAIASHETGRIVLERNLGFALSTASAECLKELLLGLSFERYQRLRGSIEAQPASQFADSTDLDQLLASIPSASAGQFGGTRK